MNSKLYRIEFPTNTKNEVIDTNIFNYGKSLQPNYYKHFLAVQDLIIDKVNIPLDFLISVSNHIVMSGDGYLQQMNDCIIDDHLDIFKLTKVDKHQGYLISLDSISSFLQSFDDNNQFIFFQDGTQLWEYYFEKIRAAEFPNLPKRLDSTFFFDSLESCDYFLNSQLNGIGTVKEVELLETRSAFTGDMLWMDNINNSITRDELFEVIRKYWNGEKTENPVNEIIFQGKYRFIN